MTVGQLGKQSGDARMPKHDFSVLQSYYPEIIAQMPPVFTSHEFFLALAQKHQADYVRALYDYVDSSQGHPPAPFQAVHAKLAKMLLEFPQLLHFRRDDAPSKDIFGQSNDCSEWEKVA
jgi:hypothetical protein